MNSIHPVPVLRWSCHHTFRILLHQLKSISHLDSYVFPLLYCWLSCVCSAIVENKFVGVRWLQDGWDWFIDFADKFVSIVMVESILEENFTDLRFAFENCDKKHVILCVKVDLHRPQFFLYVYVKELERILFWLNAQKINRLSFRWRHGKPIRLRNLLKTNNFRIVDQPIPLLLIAFRQLPHHTHPVFMKLRKEVRFPIGKEILRYKLSSIFAQRCIGQNSMRKNNHMRNIRVVTLKNIFEIGEF